IQPRSLYYAQLAERLHADVKSRAQVLPVETEASSSPTVEQAAALIAQSVKPAVQIVDWIDMTAQRQPIPVTANGAKTIDQIGIHAKAAPAKAPALHVENGWLVRGNTVVTGRRNDEPWWNGTVKPYYLKTADPAITRYVPGRTGTGLTDDLNDLTDTMVASHTTIHEHNYALWYDRRRDDHERIRRMDGEVWPPFYEVPFARTGRDTAYDGLSKYDVTRYNRWYWNRLKQFADLADQKGLVLVHQDYFQHNIIEAGAHYADFPWRPANNINNTGFPEPPPYAGDKRIFMAEQFYDTTHPVRKTIHRAYIRQCLENFKNNNGVIQTIGEEFTGPLHFVQFWLDNVGQWERENKTKEIIALSVTKDVQDAILADKKRAALVDVIDIRYWHYQENGEAYAPKGGLSLAPRQHARLLKPKRTSFDQVYRAVKEYRDANPGKAVIYSGDNYDNMAWAAFMAGGSLTAIPEIKEPRFLQDAATMSPLNAGCLEDNARKCWLLGNPATGYILY
ncbi:MAG: pectate lyase, partial [Bacteroidetes bacterium]|nr:pectate lyase [Bacteroidota bacterium]